MSVSEVDQKIAGPIFKKVAKDPIPNIKFVLLQLLKKLLQKKQVSSSMVKE